MEDLDNQFVSTIFYTYCPEVSRRIVNKEAILPALIEKLKELNIASDREKFLIDEDNYYEIRAAIENFIEVVCLYPFFESIYEETYYGYSSWFKDIVDDVIESKYPKYYLERLEIINKQKALQIREGIFKHDEREKRKILKRDEREKWEKNCKKLDNFCKAHNIKHDMVFFHQ